MKGAETQLRMRIRPLGLRSDRAEDVTTHGLNCHSAQAFIFRVQRALMSRPILLAQEGSYMATKRDDVASDGDVAE